MFTIHQLQVSFLKYRPLRDELSALISTINPVEMVTPTNLATAKRDWLNKAENGLFTNPSFSYDRQLLSAIVQKTDALCALREKLATLVPLSESEIFLRDHYFHVLEDAFFSVRMAESMLSSDDSSLAMHVFAKYGLPTEVKYATDLANRLSEERETNEESSPPKTPIFPQPLLDEMASLTLDANFIKSIFRWSMEQYCVEPWPIEIVENCSAIDVRDKNSNGRPTIVIPASRKVDGLKLAELVGHEIECHWRNSKNLLSIGCLKSDDELIYEGVAKSKDVIFRRKIAHDHTPSPYYVLAEDRALRGQSFAGVAGAIYDYTGSAQKAWTVAYRTFRGVANTSNPCRYAFTKDRAYLEGQLYVRHLRQTGKKPFLNFGALGVRDLTELSQFLDKNSICEPAVILDAELQSKVFKAIQTLL